MREYGFIEFSCNDTDQVADTASTFLWQCPPSGQFPSIYERPVLDADGNYSTRFPDSLFTDSSRSIIDPSQVYWPVCRPSVKCLDEVPAAPFYSNLVTTTVPPVKEYDSVVYTCYDDKLKLADKSGKFEIQCGSDAQYKHGARDVWPVCQPEEKVASFKLTKSNSRVKVGRDCHCLGDAHITDPELCLDLATCEAKLLLDKLCRNTRQ